MPRRDLLTDAAGLLLLGWAGLLGYVSLSGWSLDDPIEAFLIVVGVVLAGSHLVAGLGVFRRTAWARRLGMIVGGIGLVGTAVVAVTLIPGLGRVEEVTGSWTVAPLAIPLEMVATYAAIVWLLWRAPGEFSA